jgi:isopentenyldiphosphate isomerase
MNITKSDLEKLTGTKLNFATKNNGLMLATTYDNINLLEEASGKGKKPYEHFQVFDQNDQPIIINDQELVLYRTQCHGKDRIKGLYHRGGNAFIVNANNELLVPIRAPDKDLFPSMGDVSVSEHVNVRESYFDSVLRGFQEEQGVNIDPKKLKLIMKVPVIDSEQSEMCEYYAFFHEDEKYAISDETASQRWVPINSLIGKDIQKELNFRPDHLPALEKFISSYK